MLTGVFTQHIQISKKKNYKNYKYFAFKGKKRPYL